MSIIPRENMRTFYILAAILAAFLLGAHLDEQDAAVDAAVAEEATQAPSEAARQARVERAQQFAEATR